MKKKLEFGRSFSVFSVTTRVVVFLTFEHYNNTNNTACSCASQDVYNSGVLRAVHKLHRLRRRQVPELRVGFAGRDPGVSVELDDNGRIVQKNGVVVHVRVERNHVYHEHSDAGK